MNIAESGRIVASESFNSESLAPLLFLNQSFDKIRTRNTKKGVPIRQHITLELNEISKEVLGFLV